MRRPDLKLAYTLMLETAVLLRLLARGQPYQRTLPKTFRPAAVTMSASSGAEVSFDTNALQNERHPFCLQLVDVTDTTSESNWKLRLKDKAGYPIFNFIPTRLLRAYDMRTGGTAKAGALTGLGQLSGHGYVIGSGGGFLGTARSVGTATVTELALQGLWIVEA